MPTWRHGPGRCQTWSRRSARSTVPRGRRRRRAAPSPGLPFPRPLQRGRRGCGPAVAGRATGWRQCAHLHVGRAPTGLVVADSPGGTAPPACSGCATGCRMPLARPWLRARRGWCCHRGCQTGQKAARPTDLFPARAGGRQRDERQRAGMNTFSGWIIDSAASAGRELARGRRGRAEDDLYCARGQAEPSSHFQQPLNVVRPSRRG